MMMIGRAPFGVAMCRRQRVRSCDEIVAFVNASEDKSLFSPHLSATLLRSLERFF